MDRRAFLRAASLGLPALVGCSSRSVPEFSNKSFDKDDAPIHAITVTADGSKIATAHSALLARGERVHYISPPQGYVRLWEAEHRNEAGLVAEANMGRMPYPHFDDDGSLLVVAEGRAVKCDSMGSVLERYPNERLILADARRQRLVSGIEEEPSCVVVTDLAGHPISKVLRHPDGHSIHAEMWRGFSADGRLLATRTFASQDPAEVVIWDWKGGELVARFKVTNNSPFWRTAFSPDSKLVALVDSLHALRLFAIRTRRLIRSFEYREGDISDLCFSPSGLRIAVCGEGEPKKPEEQFGFARVWDAEQGRVVMDEKRPGVWGITAIEFAPDGRTLYAGLSSGELVAYARSTET